MAITRRASSFGSREELAPAAALFRALADPTRLSILQRLTVGEARVVDLTAAMGMAQSSVSAHLASLRTCGLVVARPEARQMFYSLAHPELLDVLSSAETLLEVTDSSTEPHPKNSVATTAAGDTPDE